MDCAFGHLQASRVPETYFRFLGTSPSCIAMPSFLAAGRAASPHTVIVSQSLWLCLRRLHSDGCITAFQCFRRHDKRTCTGTANTFEKALPHDTSYQLLDLNRPTRTLALWAISSTTFFSVSISPSHYRYKH